MTTPAKLGIYGAALIAIFGVAAVLGKVAGPAPRAADAEVMAPVGEGVSSAAEGYRLVPTAGTFSKHGGELTFRIERSDGDVVTQFVPTHERRLHLIIVNRELTRFHHLHPALAADGTWSVHAPALPAGSYRAVGDFRVVDGPALALGVDLSVAGDYRHPLEDAEGSVRFAATLPSAGRYRCFFDFKHGDRVHTAAFTFDQAHVTDAPSMEH